MIEDKILIRLLNSNLTAKIVTRPIDAFEYVEQLIYDVLESEGVGPVYRNIFGLRVIDEQIWLAPSAQIKLVYLWFGKVSMNHVDALLELRMRFRPFCFTRLLYEDRVAFELIFAQVRYDFLHTKFNDDDKDYVLLNDAVLGLIALDLIRHSIENSVSIKPLLKNANKNDFVPYRAAQWQRTLLFNVARQINLKTSLRLGTEQFNGNLDKVKKEYIELFLLEAAQDYGCETYSVKFIRGSPKHRFQALISSALVKTKSKSNPIFSDQMEIRVRYCQEVIPEQTAEDDEQAKEVSREADINAERDSSCMIEIRSMFQNLKSSSNGYVAAGKCAVWHQVCDIESIDQVTFERGRNIVTIASDGSSLKIKFDSCSCAKSFLSCIDGYYRLMKKWTFNLCKDVFSPDLICLKNNNCHGPICYETTKKKLPHTGSSGTFLVRRCMEKHNKYLVDAILPAKTRLTIDVNYDKLDHSYSQTDFTCNRALNIVITKGQERYSCLRSLLSDIEIRVKLGGIEDFTQQLKHWIRPSEDEDYPSLLLSISRRKLMRFLNDSKLQNNPISNLPNIIHPIMLEMSVEIRSHSKNGLQVHLGTFNQKRSVIIKDLDRTYRFEDQANVSSFTFHCCSIDHDSIGAPTRFKLIDWLFVKSAPFAETIGVMLNHSLIQEYFQLGPLDKYLADDTNVSDETKLKISFQLAQALVYLQERKIIHGKIRCNNVFVYEASPIRIKLSDPLGILDIERDQAFIPTEYFRMAIHLCVKEFYSGIDVWAYGTTLWQIFNRGTRPPPGRYANTLTKPSGCPNSIWPIIESCWQDNPADRPIPQTLCRDFNDLIAWAGWLHDYHYILRDNVIQRKHESRDLSTDSTVASSIEDLNSIDFNSRTQIISQSPNIPNGYQAFPMRSMASNSDSNRDTLLEHSTIDGVLPDRPSDVCQPSSLPRSSRLSNERKLQNSFQPKGYWGMIPTWRSLMQLTGRANFFVGRKLPERERVGNNMPMDQDLSHFSVSYSSLTSCVTPSATTILTDLPDFKSLSDALDRCIWQVDSSRLKLCQEIGRGSSGVVMKGVMYGPDEMTEQVVAVKCIDKGNSDFNPNHQHDLRQEFNIMKDLNHKNIVKILGFVESESMMLIFEHMPLGSLLSCIRDAQQDGLKKLPLQKYSHDIASGMEYLESMKIIHRDLALRNILMKNREEVKIGDFGLAQFLSSDNHYKLKTERALPLKWYAPEAICRGEFTHKSDVWSYGIVLWELYSCGDSPQYPCELKDLAEILKHERLKRPRDCPVEVYNLMLKCWAYDPEQRISFTQIREEFLSESED